MSLTSVAPRGILAGVMSFRGYVLVMAAGTLVAFFGLGKILLTIKPEEAKLSDFVFLYLSLFLVLVGFFSLVGLFFRMYVLRRRDVMSREVKNSFRHALLLAGVAVSALGLSRHAPFRWWTSFVLIFIASLIEIVSLVIQRSRRG